MSSLKKYFIMFKLLFSGYREGNQKEELYLLEALRKSDLIDDFKNICITLGKSGGLFCVPTLMAFAKDEDITKATSAINAIAKIRERVAEGETSEMIDFFSPSFWQPRWLASKENFISYVACVASIFNKKETFEDGILDSTAESLMKEIKVDIYPHETFRELRICTSNWQAKNDFILVLEELETNSLMDTVFSGGSIDKSPEAMYDDNIINMRCDYLLTRLKFNVDYSTFHYLLKVADKLNRSKS